jgi:hypothetical protein
LLNPGDAAHQNDFNRLFSKGVEGALQRLAQLALFSADITVAPMLIGSRTSVPPISVEIAGHVKISVRGVLKIDSQVAD